MEAMTTIDEVKVNFQDLTCGTGIRFRGKEYAVLSVFIDNRTTQAIITAISPQGWDADKEITVIRAFRTAKVTVFGKANFNLKRLDIEEHEITEMDLDELAEIRKAT